MKTIGFFRTNYGLGEVIVSQYTTGGRDAVFIDSVDDGTSICTLSVNLPNDHLLEGCFHVKTWSENEETARMARQSGLFEDMGLPVPTGFVMAETWRVKPIEPRKAYDACLVQDACNASGVLHSFASLLKEGRGPSDPVIVMFASKLASLAGFFNTTTPGLNTKWEEMGDLAQLALDEMKGLDSDAKKSVPTFQRLCRELQAWTYCNSWGVTNVAFKRCYDAADWPDDASKALFASKYIGEEAAV
ncbi:MAG: hypothetical protein JSS66_05815 [Armatimonadetes bacterium]|nr:hypothetical protein [Armatimonadota bacterium]